MECFNEVVVCGIVTVVEKRLKSIERDLDIESITFRVNKALNK